MTPEQLAEIDDRIDKSGGHTVELLLELFAVGMNPFTKPASRETWIRDLKRHEAEFTALLAHVGELEKIIQRVHDSMNYYAEHGSSRVNVRQVINLLSPTWPDGNYESAAPDDAGNHTTNLKDH